MVAFATNIGELTILKSYDDLDEVLHQNHDSKEWIEVMAFSPDGKSLAVGSHDNYIRIYNVSNFKKSGVCKGHSSYIHCLDWS